MNQQYQDPSLKQFFQQHRLWLSENDNVYELKLLKQAPICERYAPCSEFHESLVSTNHHQMVFHRQFDQFDNCQNSEQLFQMHEQEQLQIQRKEFGQSVLWGVSETMVQHYYTKNLKKVGRPKKCMANKLVQSENEYEEQEISESSDKVKLNKNKRSRIIQKNKNMLHFLYIEIIRFLRGKPNFQNSDRFEGLKYFGTRHQLLEIFNNDVYRLLLAQMLKSKYIMHRIMLCKMPLQRNRILYKRSIMMFIKSFLKRSFSQKLIEC